MLARWSARIRRLRRRFSRSEWGVYLLGLPRIRNAGSHRGLLLIQIDGLPRRQMERAIEEGRLPFLKRLRDREHFRVSTFYPGQPSSTPAVQGELFYGQRCAVPAFSFRDPESGLLARMFEQTAAARVQDRISAEGEGLLAGGSSYCNIYSGGADESHLCAAMIGWGNIARSRNIPRWIAILLWHSPVLLRMAGLAAVELGLACYDFVRGWRDGQDFGKELKFVASRVAVAVLLRELAVMGASMDLARGLPIIHLNFLGYDEHAHRRGPASQFAHWTLEGIDDAVRRLWSEARRSPARDYDVWIFSDHGQEETIPYPRVAGRTIQEAVAEVFDEETVLAPSADPEPGTQSTRAEWLGSGWWTRLLFRHHESPHLHVAPTMVAALGPVAHVYPAYELADEQRDAAAARLVETEHVPIVMYAAGEDHGQGKRVWAVTAEGRFELEKEPAAVIGAAHPMLDEVATDLAQLVRHPAAGSLVLCGWRPKDKPLTFAVENGAHAGPGIEETQGFLLAPRDAPLPHTGKAFVRPTDLRRAALHLLGRDLLPEAATPVRVATPARRLRIMTYNVHSCIGMDGRLSPTRIARVIYQSDVDVVALQELDVGRLRTGVIDQAHEIAKHLEMDFHFHPAMTVEEELYGDAVLSRVPMRMVRCGPLTRPPRPAWLEPRGAIWVELTLGEHKLQLINTHLGLGRGERLLQVTDLLGPDWVGNPQCETPVILCGDFNAVPRSPSYALLASRLSDAQRQLKGHRPLATWLSGRPITRIDHVFLSPGMTVRRVEVPRTEIARVASDHLPLIVEVEFD